MRDLVEEDHHKLRHQLVPPWLRGAVEGAREGCYLMVYHSPLIPHMLDGGQRPLLCRMTIGTGTNTVRGAGVDAKILQEILPEEKDTIM